MAGYQSTLKQNSPTKMLQIYVHTDLHAQRRGNTSSSAPMAQALAHNQEHYLNSERISTD
eukprot:11607633-Ditylum_brightwellii.AAC.1